MKQIQDSHCGHAHVVSLLHSKSPTQHSASPSVQLRVWGRCPWSFQLGTWITFCNMPATTVALKVTLLWFRIAVYTQFDIIGYKQHPLASGHWACRVAPGLRLSAAALAGLGRPGYLAARTHRLSCSHLPEAGHYPSPEKKVQSFFCDTYNLCY